MREFIRFDKKDRVEHWLVMVLFLTLLLTGLPQKFHGSGLAQHIIGFLGGIDAVRFLHRMTGLTFTLVAVLHLSSRAFIFLFRDGAPSMLLSAVDFKNVIIDLRYYLGVSEKRAKCDHFDYKQKFEYWGLIFGSVLMILSGFLLYFPVFFTHVLPGELIPAAKVAHTNEALLALSVIIIWHMYGCIFSPEVFPLDKSIFTGKISEERLKKEHPLEYARLVPEHEREKISGP